VKTISKKSFAGIVNVSELSMSRNQLVSIDELILGFDTNTLTRLDLSYNRIQMLTTKFTSYFINVKNLNLGYNNISFIGDFLFENMKNLQYLILGGNHLKDALNYFKLAGLINLNLLDIGSNSLKEIETNAFQDLINLNYLSLQKNEIESLNNFNNGKTN
ncbi:MAG: leucine-rich repeat protein, partial [Flavobacteriales bacterium]|nr:leucine-rich repeat protein [Flavobacteriales bacterium]